MQRMTLLTRNSTLVTPTLSDAFALIVILELGTTVALFFGAVMATVGLVRSALGVGVRVGVAVGVWVGVNVAVGKGVFVGEAVGVAVGSGVFVAVGV